MLRLTMLCLETVTKSSTSWPQLMKVNWEQMCHVWESRLNCTITMRSWYRCQILNMEVYRYCIVKIIINSINNNILIFPSNNFTDKVCKDIPISTVSTVITAMNPDIGENSEVILAESWYIEQQQSVQNAQLTSMVQLASRLDYKEGQL